MIDLSGVEIRTQSGRLILKVDSLEVAGGKFLGIVGPNGAGKSTLLRVAGGLLRPDCGSVRIENRDPYGNGNHFELLSRIGWVQQFTDFCMDVPITAEEVVLSGRVGGRGLGRRLTREDREAADYWLTRLDIHSLCREPFRTLSGGERRKVILARALAQDPILLMLDEPFAALDLEWRERLILSLDDLVRERKITTLMVTHEPGDLPASCQRAVLLDDGVIRRDGSKEEVFDPELLGRVYRCEISVSERGGRYYSLGVRPKDK